MVSRISVSRCKNSNKPLLSIAAWAQYVLDNFATVDEAVKALENEPYTIVTDSVPMNQDSQHFICLFPIKQVIVQSLNILAGNK